MSYTLIGKRESRHIVGDYVYTFKDIKGIREFKDTIAMEAKLVDVHFQRNIPDSSRPDFFI